MLDKKSISVLRAMSKLAMGSAYKVVTTDEIMAILAQKSQYDNDSLKEIISFLEKQEYINIKFSEDNTYCYSILPKGSISLEQAETNLKSHKNKNNKFLPYLFVTISSFIGTILALIIFFALVP